MHGLAGFPNSHAVQICAAVGKNPLCHLKVERPSRFQSVNSGFLGGERVPLATIGKRSGHIIPRLVPAGLRGVPDGSSVSGDLWWAWYPLCCADDWQPFSARAARERGTRQDRVDLRSCRPKANSTSEELIHLKASLV